jgi:hypothetical protein
MSSDRYILRDKRLQTEFSDVAHWQLSPELASKYQTADGTHLLPSGAKVFSEALGERISEL